MRATSGRTQTSPEQRGAREKSGFGQAWALLRPVAAVLLALSCLAIGMTLNPKAALAEEDLVLERGPQVTEKLRMYYMLDHKTKRVLYCITRFFGQPEPDHTLLYGGRVLESVKAGEEPGSGFDISDEERKHRMAAQLDYIAYHGYFGDTTMKIGTITGDATKLYLTTQLAIYHVLEGKEGRSAALDDPAFTDEIVAASDLLFRQAKEYAEEVVTKGGYHVEARSALWFKDSDTTAHYQNILTRDAKGKLNVQKVSSDETITSNNPSYSLKGARFAVYSDEQCTIQVDHITTDANGFGTTKKTLASGDYWVRELTPPKGFTVFSETIKVHIAGGPQTAVIQEVPDVLPIGTVIAKVDAETKATEPRLGSSLAGAQFVASFYAGTDITNTEPTRSWTLKSDEGGKVALDAEHLADKNPQPLYVDATGKPGLPAGTLVMTEVDPPKGYRLPSDPTWTFRIALGDDGKLSLLEQTDKGLSPLEGAKIIEEPTVRGDIEFDKAEVNSNKPLPNVVFRVTSRATGESHLIKTDEKGHFASGNVAHSRTTNALDGAINQDGSIDESKLSIASGLWFYGYARGDGPASSPVDDTRGAFPYGSYLFEELRTSSTVGRALRSFEVSIAEEGSVVSAGTIVDDLITLSTSARDAADQDKYLPQAGRFTIEDSVRYSGLTIGQEYTLTCTLHDADTGDELKTASGQPLSASIAFKPTRASGTQTVSVLVEGLSTGLSRVVAYERLTQNGQLVASHEDRNDQEQTVYVPSLATMLTDASDQDHSVLPDATVNLIDTVNYGGLIPGQAYRLEGRIINRANGQPLTDGEGHVLAAATEFVPDSTEGQAQVSFSIDASNMAGQQLVAVETLFQGDATICTHEDLNDANQTVTVGRKPVALPNTGSRSLLALTISCGALFALATALLIWHLRTCTSY